MNASSMVSRRTATASGSSSRSAAGSHRRSGRGCSQGMSVRATISTGSDPGPSGPDPVVAGPRSCGRTRRARPSGVSRQALVAMRYSQARSLDRPSKPPMWRHARRNVSWTRSSASSTEPTMR